MVLLIGFFLLSIIFSFLCSIWEAVLLSVTPSYVAVKNNEGTTSGKLLKSQKDDVDRPLSAILTLNTIAHTVGATGVGAQAAVLWPNLSWDFSIFSYSFSLSVAAVIVPALMTLAILVFSEIIPKTLGASYWKTLAPFTARGINITETILQPFVWMSRKITQLIKGDGAESVFSRKDFHTMASIGEREGIFRPEESEIIRNLLQLNKVTAESIMTPRTVVLMAPADLTVQEFYDKNKPVTFSRIPIYSESRDNVQGFVLKDNLFNALLENKGNTKLSSFMREITVMKEETPIQRIFDKLISQREHIALITDEYGGTEGLVTMEDVFETLLGAEIMDELDSVEDLQKLAKSRVDYPGMEEVPEENEQEESRNTALEGDDKELESGDSTDKKSDTPDKDKEEEEEEEKKQQ